jgi:GNAT superfamily N-acetyltransferase
MGLVFEEQPLDAPDAHLMIKGFEADLVLVYPGWDPNVGPSARREDFAAPGGAFLVAYENGRALAGGGLKRLDSERVEIKRMYVVPGARGKGVARALLGAPETTAAYRGYAFVRLDTGPKQPEALALYRSAGYEPIDDYNDNPYATYWFEKRLGNGG